MRRFQSAWLIALPLVAAACGNSTGPKREPYSPIVLADAPLLYFRFGESTTAADSSGNGHGGVYLGSPTFNASLGAQTGKAIRLANTYGTYTDTGVGVYAGSWSDVTALTLEAWVQPAKVTTSEGQMIIDKGDTWNLDISADGHALFQFPSYAFLALHGPVLQVGQRYHLVGTYAPPATGSQNGGVMKLYVNGALAVENDNGPPAIPVWGTRAIHVGTGLSSGSWGYSGVVDEVAIYDHALSADQVLKHYNAGK